jgi:hypothetical protein
MAPTTFSPPQQLDLRRLLSPAHLAWLERPEETDPPDPKVAGRPPQELDHLLSSCSPWARTASSSRRATCALGNACRARAPTKLCSLPHITCKLWLCSVRRDWRETPASYLPCGKLVITLRGKLTQTTDRRPVSVSTMIRERTECALTAYDCRAESSPPQRRCHAAATRLATAAARARSLYDRSARAGVRANAGSVGGRANLPLLGVRFWGEEPSPLAPLVCSARCDDVGCC